MEFQRDDREVLVPVWDKPEPVLDFRQIKNHILPDRNPWRVLPEDKGVPVHKSAATLGALVEIYPNAIVLGPVLISGLGGRYYSGGLGMFFSLIFTSVISWGLFVALKGELDFVLILMYLGALYLVVMAGVFSFRSMQYVPPDSPILFNRKNKTVAYFRKSRPSFFQPWRSVKKPEVVVRPWQETRARTYRYKTSSGRGVFTIASDLYLIWADKGDPTKVVDFIMLSDPITGDDYIPLMRWEHVRRYMEEAIAPNGLAEELRPTPSDSGNLLRFPEEIIKAAS